jgi:hypothetical protein
MFKIDAHITAGYIDKLRYRQITDKDGQADWEIFYTPGPSACSTGFLQELLENRSDKSFARRKPGWQSTLWRVRSLATTQDRPICGFADPHGVMPQAAYS